MAPSPSHPGFTATTIHTTPLRFRISTALRHDDAVADAPMPVDEPFSPATSRSLGLRGVLRRVSRGRPPRGHVMTVPLQ
jgi:hypothetical protein